jgi:hypothetical protein
VVQGALVVTWGWLDKHYIACRFINLELPKPVLSCTKDVFG